jgi:multicomponent Na+:H+ antiporter subunit D
MPLHNWRLGHGGADTGVGPAMPWPVKAGVLSICRCCPPGVNLMDALGWGRPRPFSPLTIVLASVIALTKDDLKARLAYSTVSQLSYVVLGVSMLTPLAVTGGVAHIAHHAFSKITLFFTAGAIYVATHQKKISMLSGVGRRMPWTFGAFAVASLSMIGVPPVSGFVSKWYMVNGAVDAGHYALLAALLASTILNAAYFTPVVYKAFFEEPAPGIDLSHYSRGPLSMVCRCASPPRSAFSQALSRRSSSSSMPERV